NLVYAGLIWICVRRWGLTGAGVAFFGLYIYYCVLMRIVTQRLSGFVWSAANRRLAAIAIPTLAFVLACPLFLSAPWDTIAAGAATLAAGLYSLRTLLSLPGNQGIRDAVVSRIPCFARPA
ncbi:MAG TPA: hypothetical protein VKB36_18155, partial [Vicinamibacterales bacterium]|nr:hypothetical protein [Vicinamibacterales bacterium]